MSVAAALAVHALERDDLAVFARLADLVFDRRLGKLILLLLFLWLPLLILHFRLFILFRIMDLVNGRHLNRLWQMFLGTGLHYDPSIELFICLPIWVLLDLVLFVIFPALFYGVHREALGEIFTLLATDARARRPYERRSCRRVLARWRCGIQYVIGNFY